MGALHMAVEPARIESNLAAVREKIAAAAARAGRNPAQVRLIAVTKEVGCEEVRTLYALGLRHFAENRLEAAEAKIIDLARPDARWHMIAPLQRRKAPRVVALFDCMDAIDRLEAAVALQQRCEAQEKHLPVLVELNISGEASKHGLTPEALPQVLDAIGGLDRIELEGLMTMAPLGAPPEEARDIFRRLRLLAEARDLPRISMGMSNDFELAVEEGATEVRIGHVLFA